jgi:hypothetical protein
MDNGGLTGAAPADQCVVVGGELQPFLLAPAHETGIFDLDGRDAVLGGLEGVEGALVAAADGDTVAIEQGQAQPFQRGARPS